MLLWVGAALVSIAAGSGVEAQNYQPFRITDNLDSNEGPRLAYNLKSDQFLVVYSRRNDSNDVDNIWLHGRILDRNGNWLTGEVKIVQIPPFAPPQSASSSWDVVYNRNRNEYMVVHERAQPHHGINGRVVRANGVRKGRMWHISDSRFGEDPKVAYNQALREYLVVWRDLPSFSPYVFTPNAVNARFLFGNGRPFGPVFGLIGNDGSTSYSTDELVFNEVVLSYVLAGVRRFPGPEFGGFQTYGLGVFWDGSVIDGIRNYGYVNQPRDFQLTADVVTNEFDTRGLVVWEDLRPHQSWINGFSRWIGWDGGTLHNPRKISDRSVPVQQVFRVTFDENRHQYLVVWLENTSNTTQRIMGRYVAVNGFPFGREFVITDPVRFPTLGLDVVFDRLSNRYLVVYAESVQKIAAGLVGEIKGIFVRPDISYP
ncbi:MAG TPA: hypothetical protein VGB99_18575 [Acidobacteriota bacterium]